MWSRADLDHMRAIRCDHNYRTHELVARELEREFGHARVQGVHVERDGPNGERVDAVTGPDAESTRRCSRPNATGSIRKTMKSRDHRACGGRPTAARHSPRRWNSRANVLGARRSAGF